MRRQTSNDSLLAVFCPIHKTKTCSFRSGKDLSNDILGLKIDCKLTPQWSFKITVHWRSVIDWPVHRGLKKDVKIYIEQNWALWAKSEQKVRVFLVTVWWLSFFSHFLSTKNKSHTKDMVRISIIDHIFKLALFLVCHSRTTTLKKRRISSCGHDGGPVSSWRARPAAVERVGFQFVF